MKIDLDKLTEQAEDIRDALGALADATKSMPLDAGQAERLIPFVHDAAEIAIAFGARLQAVFLNIPESKPVAPLLEGKTSLIGDRVRCQYIGPDGKQCEKPAIGLTPDDEHVACKKHGGVKRETILPGEATGERIETKPPEKSDGSEQSTKPAS